MLPLKAREKSFSSVRSFAGASGGSPDNFYRRVNVTVRHGQEEYLYRGIYMSIGYQYNYMDYKVELIWEDDTSQPNYEDIGLHGEYSTNWPQAARESSISAASSSAVKRRMIGCSFLSIFVGDHSIAGNRTGKNNKKMTK